MNPVERFKAGDTVLLVELLEVLLDTPIGEVQVRRSPRGIISVSQSLDHEHEDSRGKSRGLRSDAGTKRADQWVGLPFSFT